MLGLGSNITGGSPVGIVGAPPPAFDYFYESDFATDPLSFAASTQGEVLSSFNGINNVLRVYSPNTFGYIYFLSSNNLLNGKYYKFEITYYAESSSNVSRISVSETGGVYSDVVTSITYDEWVTHTSDAIFFDNGNVTNLLLRISSTGGGQIYISQLNIIDVTGQQPPVSLSPPPGGYYDGALDQSSLSYEGAAAAYSLRLVYSYYDGPAIRVRRASDNTEQDIGFSNGVLDTSTLSTFCSGTDGFVKTWYDQSGNGNDATQTTTANQPKIYDSSTGVITENGKPAMYHDTGSKYLIAATPSGFSGKSQSAFITGLTYRTATNPDFYFAIGDTTASTGTLRGITQEPYLRFSTTVQDYNSYHEDNVQHLYSMVCPGTVTTIDDYDLYRNGSFLTPDSLNGGTVNNIATDFLHIGNNTIENLPFYGLLQELVFYNSDQSSNRSGIETNINDFYTIY